MAHRLRARAPAAGARARPGRARADRLTRARRSWTPSTRRRTRSSTPAGSTRRWSSTSAPGSTATAGTRLRSPRRSARASRDAAARPSSHDRGRLRRHRRRPGRSSWAEPPAAARLGRDRRADARGRRQPTTIRTSAGSRSALGEGDPRRRDGGLLETGHLPGVERPDELNGLVLDFLARRAGEQAVYAARGPKEVYMGFLDKLLGRGKDAADSAGDTAKDVADKAGVTRPRTSTTTRRTRSPARTRRREVGQARTASTRSATRRCRTRGGRPGGSGELRLVTAVGRHTVPRRSARRARPRRRRARSPRACA